MQEFQSASLSKRAVQTLLIATPATIIGLVLLMAWGQSAQAGQQAWFLGLAGVVGYILLLPAMLLGYVVEYVGGLGMVIETFLLLTVQFIGYVGLLSAIERARACFARTKSIE